MVCCFSSVTKPRSNIIVEASKFQIPFKSVDHHFSIIFQALLISKIGLYEEGTLEGLPGL